MKNAWSLCRDELYLQVKHGTKANTLPQFTVMFNVEVND